VNPAAGEIVQSGAVKDAGPVEKAAGRSPLTQLLHALNQPLTGLQCSMEVALTAPRSPEQYVQGLRDGLVLTGRLRALVEALREVVDGEADGQGKGSAEPETTEWQGVIWEAVDDLRPVAEMKNVRILVDSFFSSSCSGWAVKARRAQLASGVFRTLESVLALATSGSALQVAGGFGSNEVWFRIQWQGCGEASQPGLSRPELGLLIAQARLERTGAAWEREGTEDGERLTVRLPGGLGARGSLQSSLEL